MTKIIKQFASTLNFTIADAVDIIEFITIEEEVINMVTFDYIRAYEYKGARWSREELLEDANSCAEYVSYTIDEVLNWDCVKELPSGLLLTWNY